LKKESNANLEVLNKAFLSAKRSVFACCTALKKKQQQ